MEYTEKPKASLKTKFAAAKRKQIVVALVLIPVIFLFVFFERRPDQLVLGVSVKELIPAFLVLVIGAVGFSLYNWRCPGCRKYLGKTFNPKFCPKCGVELS